MLEVVDVLAHAGTARTCGSSGPSSGCSADGMRRDGGSWPTLLNRRMWQDIEQRGKPSKVGHPARLRMLKAAEAVRS
ncbi:MAG: hypothetical protein R2844_01750 [Caldilineales bacterium]